MTLELVGLTKKYGDIVALKSFSYSYGKGIYGILGANGAGKSTMMNLIVDNVRRDEGEILWGGKDVLVMGADFRRVLGYMPQQQGFYEHMTAYTFLVYMAELKGIPKKRARANIADLLELTNLTDVKYKKLYGYSGGMRQRVLLCQALLGEPKVLILDEPTAGLDPKERIRIRNFISTIARDRVILLATHIVSDIESIADQILLMQKGELVMSGTSTELVESIRGKVKEIPCEPNELEDIQGRYRVGNVFQRGGGTWVRLIGDDLPISGSFVEDHLSLEDVYLYYLGE